MDRVRHWLGINGQHREEHAEIEREVVAMTTRLKVLDAYVDARGARLERRRMMALEHPNRRVNDA